MHYVKNFLIYLLYVCRYIEDLSLKAEEAAKAQPVSQAWGKF